MYRIVIKSWFRKVFKRLFSFSFKSSSSHSLHPQSSVSNSSEFVSRVTRVVVKGRSNGSIKSEEDRLMYLLSKEGYFCKEVGKSCYVLSSFTIGGINYRDPSNDVCVNVIILGRYSYPDIDITKSGTICKDVLTGRLYDFDDWTIFYDYVPHIWVRFLVHEDRWNYSSYMSEGCSMFELSDKFLCCVPKDELRDIRLGELGI